ncbi:MAG TPA: ankyrin repeat domain-containing protein [Streptosporangiaceae bacterium]|nr:ankyrin repeat domain-containing protein [Streptosporangiaceae bacterium]
MAPAPAQDRPRAPESAVASHEQKPRFHPPSAVRTREQTRSVLTTKISRKLVAGYNAHVFDSLVIGHGRTTKRDPRRKKNQTQIEGVVALTWAASQGDLNEVRALVASGVEPSTADYDGRTALHLAAAEGQLDVVRYLLAAGADPQPADRWGGTPHSDAEANGHAQVAELIRRAAQPDEGKVAI